MHAPSAAPDAALDAILQGVHMGGDVAPQRLQRVLNVRAWRMVQLIDGDSVDLKTGAITFGEARSARTARCST